VQYRWLASMRECWAATQRMVRIESKSRICFAVPAIPHLSAIVLRLRQSQNSFCQVQRIEAERHTTIVRKQIRSKPDEEKPKNPRRRKPSQQPDATVLVVDDDESALAAIARLIRSAGYNVRAFGDPRALLDEQIPTTMACLVADIYLPEMNGIELSEALIGTGHSLPTILITGRDDEVTRRLAENSTAIAVLFKPIDEAPLLEAIARCLKPQLG
jgi:CheY-like chemotaxis protein